MSLPGLTGQSSTPGLWLLDRPVEPGEFRSYANAIPGRGDFGYSRASPAGPIEHAEAHEPPTWSPDADTTRRHGRIGTRERLVETQEKYPGNLAIELDALVTRILFDTNNRAIGVEYLKGALRQT